MNTSARLDDGPGEHQRQRILVIDDDPMILELLDDALGNEYEVETESDPVLGLNRAREQAFDLMILDLGMPNLNGIELIEHLETGSSSGHPPIIVMSAFPELRRQVRGLPVAAVVAKPFSIDELSQAVARALTLYPRRSRQPAER